MTTLGASRQQNCDPISTRTYAILAIVVVLLVITALKLHGWTEEQYLKNPVLDHLPIKSQL